MIKIKERHIPRNNYVHVEVNPLMAYMCKYKFHLFAIGYDCIDLELGIKVKFDTMLEVLNWLNESQTELGIPIKEGGFKCITEQKEDEIENPYFKVEIILDHRGNLLKTKKSAHPVYSVRK